MNRRKATVGLSLLCALVACAFAAQSASAASATNTTAVTCTEGAASKDFTDAHCDNEGAGKFGHTALKTGETVEVFVSNEKTKNNTKEYTPAIFKGTIFGVKFEMTCGKATGTGVLENYEPTAGKHQVTGVIATEYYECPVQKPAIGCVAEQPIKTAHGVSGVEGLGLLKNEMGLEFKPGFGEVFAEITLKGCIAAGTFKITGTAIGTGNPAPTEKHSGATNVFTNAMTKETLKLAGNPAEISSATTVTTKTGGSPVALTTAT